MLPAVEQAIHRALSKLRLSDAVSFDDVLGPSRQPHIVAVRRETARILWDRGFSYAAIGGWLNRDYSTIYHLVKTEGRSFNGRSG